MTAIPDLGDLRQQIDTQDHTDEERALMHRILDSAEAGLAEFPDVTVGNLGSDVQVTVQADSVNVLLAVADAMQSVFGVDPRVKLAALTVEAATSEQVLAHLRSIHTTDPEAGWVSPPTAE